jgi:hypothetical protein
MDALRKQASSGNADIETFWKHVTAEGTPLVESIEKDPHHQLVTFLWRDTPETRNVLLNASLQVGGRHPLDCVMHQIPHTEGRQFSPATRGCALSCEGRASITKGRGEWVASESSVKPTVALM